MWDGDILKGPVPTIFTDDVRATEEGMNGNLERTHADMRRLARAFFMPEHVSPNAAMALVKKPRY
jgi:hypothetical protein